MAELNRKQSEAVEGRTNMVVTAGAGSGKTTVLARRYIALIEEGYQVESILCLTFTRKAAAEMYERIYRSLLDLSESSVAAQRAVDRFEDAQIATLDSFSGRVVRSASSRFGLNPDFRVDEGELRRVIESESLQFLLSRSDAPGLRMLISAKGFTSVWTEILQPIAFDHFSLAREEPLQHYARFQRELLAGALREHSEVVRLACRELEALDGTVGKSVLAVSSAAGKVLDSGLLEEQELDRQAERVLRGEEIEEFDRWVSELAGSFQGVRNQSGKDPAYDVLQERLPEARAGLEELKRIAESAATTSEELLESLEEYRSRILSVKRELGLLSYQDVVELSILALREDLELRQFFKEKFSQIMIDEFQDNNNDQRELLFLLAERLEEHHPGVPPATALAPAKLFFVGDEKQSIYRFRGADVSVFKELSTELEAAGGRTLSLTVNYRSEPALIAAFNELFASVFREGEKPHEARFEPLEPREESDPLPSRFELGVLDDEDRDPQKDRHNGESEAAWVAERIAELLEDPAARVRDRRTGELRRPTPGDIAVLFRSGSSQHILERMLRLARIPYGTQSVRSLFLEAPAYDIYAFLQCLLYPEDRLAYAALLRSPFGSIGDDSLLELLIPAEPAFETPGDAVRDPADRERYQLLAEMYRRGRELYDRVPLTELVDFLWYEAGYRQILLSDPANHPYLEHYDFLFQLASQQEGRPLEEFLHLLRANLGEFERLDELNLPEGTGRVELMTIHKSKGLEFPVVFVMDAGNVGRGEGGEPFYWMEELGPVMNIPRDPARSTGNRREGNYFVQRAKEEEQEKGEAELRRLLYVAATRAESHLIVSGYLHKGNRKSERPKALIHIFAQALGLDTEKGALASWPSTALAGRLELVRIEPLSDERYRSLTAGVRHPALSGRALYEEAAQAEPPRLTRRVLPSDFNSFALGTSAPRGPSGAGLGEQPEAELDSPAGGALERALGTYAHRLIELRVRSMQEGGTLEPEAAWVAALFSEVPEAATEGALAEAQEMAARFFESDLWREIEGARRLESELSVLSHYDHPQLGLLFVQGQFDLYVESGELCRVIDFKTDRHIAPEEYRYQLALYADAARKLSGRPVTATIFGLREAVAFEVPPVDRGELDDLLLAYVLG